MAIDYTTAVYELSDYQLSNMWEFVLDDFTDLQFHVVSASVPQIALTLEERSTGDRHYNGYTPEGQFSLEIRETNNFDIYNYFKGWLNQVYDSERRVFRLNPPVKQGSLVYSKFQATGTRTVEYIVKEVTKGMNFDRLTRKEIETRVIRGFGGQRSDTITEKEIVYTIFSALQQRAVNLVNNLRSFTGAQRIQPDLPVKEQSTRVSSVNIPKRRDELIRRIQEVVRQNPSLRRQINTFDERETKVFNFQNIRILGIDPITTDYSSADALTLTINLSAERITEDSPRPVE